MKRIRILFENRGQSFQEWVIDENQIVVDGWPAGKGIWKGTKVLTLCIGFKPDIKTPYEDRERQLNYAVIDLKEEEYDENKRIVDMDLEQLGVMSFGDSIRKFGHRL